MRTTTVTGTRCVCVSMMITQRIWMFIFLTSSAVEAGETITCGVIKASPENYTLLTCYFPEDVTLTRRHIQVHRLNTNDGQSTLLLDCKWFSGNPLCYEKTGVLFDRNFTNQINIELYNWSVRNIMDELYTCRLLSPELYEALPCKQFGDGGRRNTCSLSQAPKANYTRLTCHLPEEVSLSKGSVQVKRKNRSKGESTILLDCKWPGEKLLCFVKSGVIFDENLTNHVALEIPMWSSEDWKDEVYTCQFSHPDLFEAIPCTFMTRQEKVITTSTVSFLESSERAKGDNTSATGTDTTNTTNARVTRKQDGTGRTINHAANIFT